MAGGMMPRLHRRISYIAVAIVAIIFFTNFFLSTDSLPRVMKTDSGTVIKPPGSTGENKPEEALKIAPPPAEDPNKLKELVAQLPMKYGTQTTPKLRDDSAVHIADLPHSLLPEKGNNKRLVIVGDVHGQLLALKTLLAKVNFDKEKGDHLILTGDMVNKGPDSVGVVQYAMDVNASAVRGNHEDRVLLSHKEGKRNSAGKDGWLDTMLKNMKLGVSPLASTTEQAPLARPGTESELGVAATFSDAHFSWLDSLPVILKMGPFKSAKTTPWNAGTIAVVHAGLVPGLPLEKQSPQTVMTMRSFAYPGEIFRKANVRKHLDEVEKAKKEATEKLNPGKKVEQKKVEEKDVYAELERLSKLGLDRMADRRVLFPLESRDGQPWSEVWSRHQSAIKFEEDRTTVIYGHDAKVGLRVAPDVEEEKLPQGLVTPPNVPKAIRYAFGLDSGCVYGNQLSALVLEADKETGDIRHTVVQVECQKAAEAPKN